MDARFARLLESMKSLMQVVVKADAWLKTRANFCERPGKTLQLAGKSPDWAGQKGNYVCEKQREMG